jgi:hypothetical protein
LLAPGVRQAIATANRLRPMADLYDAAAPASAIERAAYADLHGFLPHNVLRGTDRMSMALVVVEAWCRRWLDASSMAVAA